MIVVACAGGPPPTRPATTPVIDKPAVPDPTSEHGEIGIDTEPGSREIVQRLREADAEADAGKRFSQKETSLKAIRALADPRGADALYEYASAPRHTGISKGELIHFRTQAAFALAELGDVRAAVILGERLKQDPLRIYDAGDPNQAELQRSDNERVVAARLIADLAELHPDRLEQLRQATAEGLAHWIEERPAPHSNALRARARLGIRDASVLHQLEDWSDPKTLPKRGQQPPFPMELEIAESALRWLGASKDPKAASILKKQLGRRPQRFDATLSGLMSSGSAVLGMGLRALGMGASQGLAELGDPQAIPSLLRYVDEEKENEQSRVEACHAVATLLTDAQAPEVAKRLLALRAQQNAGARFRLECLVSGLAIQSVDPLGAPLLGLLTNGVEPSIRLVAAIALGRRGLDRATEQALMDKLGPDATEAPIALLLGGSPDAVARVATLAASSDDAWVAQVSDNFRSSIDAVHAADLQRGHLFRWVENARRLAGAQRRKQALTFAEDCLRDRIADAPFDSGPGTLTLVVLRGRLLAIARKAGPDAKHAVETLELLRERGVLLALGERSDETGALCRAALARLPAPAADR